MTMGYSFVLLLAETAVLLERVHIFVLMGDRNTFDWYTWAILVANIEFFCFSDLCLDLCRLSTS